jgi:hypothetical protein
MTDPLDLDALEARKGQIPEFYALIARVQELEARTLASDSANANAFREAVNRACDERMQAADETKRENRKLQSDLDALRARLAEAEAKAGAGVDGLRRAINYCDEIHFDCDGTTYDGGATQDGWSRACNRIQGYLESLLHIPPAAEA